MFLTILKLTCKRNSDNTLDKAILNTIFLHKATTLNAKLEHCIKWQRVDLVNDIIAKGAAINGDEMNDFVTKILVQENPDFLENMIVAGLSIKKFLTVDRLRSLYNGVVR